MKIDLSLSSRTSAAALLLGALAACASDGEPALDAHTFEQAEQAYPGERGELRRGVLDTPSGPRELTYEVLHGHAVVEGDMLFPLPTGQTRGAVRTRGTRRWSGGVVPYTLDPALANTVRVTDAMAHWEAETRFTFVPRTTELDYVTFRPSAGCSSQVGRAGGQQFVNVSDGCNAGNLIHEIGHTLGMWHEQSRSDRDHHVIIHWDRIEPGKAGNFQTFADAGNDGRNAGPYDLSSIMHYGSYGFSLDGQPTMTELDGSIIVPQRDALTATDVCAINAFQGWGHGSDVNGDGYADLIAGVPNEDTAAVGNEGALSVTFGGPTGLTSTNQFLHRDLAGIEDVAGGGDQLGFSVTVGDFNGDCFADAAVGVPFDDVAGVVDAGSVHVFYGSPLGLAVDEVWHQDSAGVVGTAAAGDRFGHALGSGDFNGDGYADLAIGIPYKDLGALVDTGSVSILYGSATGLSATGSQLWNQNTGTIQEGSESDDRFGWAVAAGDFNGDGFDELVAGAPNEDVGGAADAGVVHVIYGSLDGLSELGNQMWVEDNAAIPDVSEAGDLFGFALAAGDFDADGREDLAIGVPLEDLGAVVDAGSVTVLLGTSTGLLAGGAQVWNQDTAGILDVAEPSDVFGRALEVGDFDRDGYLDLVVGAPYEDLGAINSAGALHVLRGSAAGLTEVGDALWHQDSAGIGEVAEAGDTFAYRLRAGDYDGDGFSDLAVGVPGESVGPAPNAGAAHLLRGSGGGLGAAGQQLWHQDVLGVLDTAEASDLFAHGL